MTEHSATPGPAYDAHEAHQEHYSSVASWTLVTMVMLGALVACIAFVRQSMALGVFGIVIIIGGLVAGRVLASMGYGTPGRQHS